MPYVFHLLNVDFDFGLAWIMMGFGAFDCVLVYLIYFLILGAFMLLSLSICLSSLRF